MRTDISEEVSGVPDWRVINDAIRMCVGYGVLASPANDIDHVFDV